MKVYEIVPGLVYQRGEFRKYDAAFKAGCLDSLEISSVVCLVDHYDTDMESLLGERYLFLPISDGKKVGKIVLQAAKKVGDWIVENNSKVLVHCRVGRNRSSLFSALLVVRLLGLTGSKAVEYMQIKRPRALANEHFVRFLKTIKRYDKVLGKYRRVHS